jgi:type III secretory pathway component EscT
MKRVSLALVAAVAFASPLFAHAQLGNIANIVEAIGGLIRLATPIVIGLALLAFFWGLVKYIFAGADEDKAAGKSLMIGGIIAIFVMVSIVGIIEFIGNALGVDQGGNLEVPGVENLPR